MRLRWRFIRACSRRFRCVCLSDARRVSSTAFRSSLITDCNQRLFCCCRRLFCSRVLIVRECRKDICTCAYTRTVYSMRKRHSWDRREFYLWTRPSALFFRRQLRSCVFHALNETSHSRPTANALPFATRRSSTWTRILSSTLRRMTWPLHTKSRNCNKGRRCCLRLE